MPTDRDLDTARETLSSWLAGRTGGEAEVGPLTAPAGVGMINETLFFDATFAGKTASLVLRVMPSSHTVMFEAQRWFEPQCRLCRVLAERTDVPVPAIRFYEEDPAWLGAPFVVIDRVAGQTQPDIPPYWMSGWLHDADPGDQALLYERTLETIARINTLDWRALGLDFLLDPDRGEPGFEQRMNWYLEAYEWGRVGRRCEIVETARDWLIENRPAAEDAIALSWGDARIANAIYRDFEVAGVVDWEISSLGPPQQDIGWWLFVDRALFGDRHSGDPDDPQGLPGFPPREATIARWGELTGFSTETVGFYETFAGFRLAINVQRTGVLFGAAGAISPESRWPECNFATAALAEVLGVEHPEPEPMPGHVGASS
jgi:aminoglycoside phosphotransferase (APT) family kinase protein